MQHGTGSSSQCNNITKRNKRHGDQKGKKIKPFLFVAVTTVYTENQKESRKIIHKRKVLLELNKGV